VVHEGSVVPQPCILNFPSSIPSHIRSVSDPALAIVIKGCLSEEDPPVTLTHMETDLSLVAIDASPGMVR
jgi:hypothetical protein